MLTSSLTYRMWPKSPGVDLVLALSCDCCVIAQTVWIEVGGLPQAEADAQGNCLQPEVDSVLSSRLSQELLISAKDTSSPGSS